MRKSWLGNQREIQLGSGIWTAQRKAAAEGHLSAEASTILISMGAPAPAQNNGNVPEIAPRAQKSRAREALAAFLTEVLTVSDPGEVRVHPPSHSYNKLAWRGPSGAMLTIRLEDQLMSLQRTTSYATSCHESHGTRTMAHRSRGTHTRLTQRRTFTHGPHNLVTWISQTTQKTVCTHAVRLRTAPALNLATSGGANGERTEARVGMPRPSV